MEAKEVCSPFVMIMIHKKYESLTTNKLPLVKRVNFTVVRLCRTLDFNPENIGELLVRRSSSK